LISLIRKPFDAIIGMFGRPKIALFIDGPNLLRKEFDLDLSKIKQELEKYGDVREAAVCLNQFAPHKLVEAIAAQGFTPLIGVGDTKDDDKSDVDVYVATVAIEAIYNRNIDVIALGTRDADFLPVLQLAKKHGKKVIVLGQEPGFSKALQNIADVVINLQGKTRARVKGSL